MKRLVLILAAALALAGCKGSKTLLPNVSGKAGEVIVVIEKEDWDGSLGDAVRSVLGKDCEFLAQLEPLYSLANVAPGGFGDLFKVHRNIVLFRREADADKGQFAVHHDLWASPQCVICITARNANEAEKTFKDNAELIVSAIEQAERDRVIASSKRYEQKDIANAVRTKFEGSPHFPTGYKLKKMTDDFVWVADEKQYTIQGIFIYTSPAERTDNDFSRERIIERRNEALKANVPGMFENTYMTTSPSFEVSVCFLKYKGRSFAQTRGMWDVENDFMGGPFVSHSFYSKDGTQIITTEAFVYAPRFDKRQYLRQVESILYSWD